MYIHTQKAQEAQDAVNNKSSLYIVRTENFLLDERNKYRTTRKFTLRRDEIILVCCLFVWCGFFCVCVGEWEGAKTH